jgi:hypothetical protein
MDFLDFFVEEDFDAGFAAFGGKHADDFLGESFFMIGDVVLFNERDEVRRSETGESGFGEVRIGGDEIFGAAMNVGEIAAAASGDENFFADLTGAFEKGDSTTALSGLDGTEEAGGSGTEDDGVKEFSQGRILTGEEGWGTRKNPQPLAKNSPTRNLRENPSPSIAGEVAAEVRLDEEENQKSCHQLLAREHCRKGSGARRFSRTFRSPFPRNKELG